MAKGKKYYVVWRGYRPGVYESWADCAAQVKGYVGAQFRSYPTREEAERAYSQPYEARVRGESGVRRAAPGVPGPVYPSLAVDAACNMRTGRMEYRGVSAYDGRVIFSMGPYADTTNNVGEFLALVHALALCNRPGNEEWAEVTIYSDSVTALAWVRNRKANTAMKPTEANRELRMMVARAEEWLRTHAWRNPVLKWNTEAWGEIPADYGRK